MSATLAVLRPEPGNTATRARAAAAGFATLTLPLFEVVPLAWDVPDAAEHDALILTSANAVRHAGPGLRRLLALPVFAVGPHTAAVARAWGFDVMEEGHADARAVLVAASARGVTRALHLAGRDRTPMHSDAIAATVPVYASDPRRLAAADLAALRGTTALLHSMRAARRFGELVDRTGIARGDVALAAFSPAVASAAGGGWAAVAVAASPDDAALLAAAWDIATPTKR